MGTKTRLNDRENRVVAEAIENCSLAEPSDPFVAARVRAHFKSGVAKISGPDGADYSASLRTVTKKLSEGEVFSDGSNEYSTVEYFNRRRP